MSSGKQDGNGLWLVFVIIIGIVMFVQALSGGGSSSSSASSAPASVDRGSFEHRYATERFKQEGYNKAESQQAADAVIKFHNAQQNRKK